MYDVEPPSRGTVLLLLFSTGVAGPQRWREGQLYPRVGYMSPSQSAIGDGSGVSTPSGAVSTGGSPYSSPACWN